MGDNLLAIITSMPPKTPKRLLDGKEYSTDYRFACMESWRGLGKNVISVNSEKEVTKVGLPSSDIKTVSVKSDGTQYSGKPLVLVQDLISCGLGSNSDLIAFINSDIYLADVQKIRDAAQSLKSGQAIVARRLNIYSLDEPKSETYRHGYDLFIIKREDLTKAIPKIELYFGEPWWDYYIFCTLITQGLSIKVLGSRHVLHLYHEDAFEWKRWEEIGRTAINSLAAIGPHDFIKSQHSRKLSKLVTNFMVDIRRCGKPSHIHIMRMLLGKNSGEITRESLHKFSWLLSNFAEKDIGFEISLETENSSPINELRTRLINLSQSPV